MKMTKELDHKGKPKLKASGVDSSFVQGLK